MGPDPGADSRGSDDEGPTAGGGDDGFDEVFGSAISKAVRRAVDDVGRNPLGSLDAGTRVPQSPKATERAPTATAPPVEDAPPPMPALGVTDPYELLGVNRRAPWPEIVAAYKRRARAWHPDGASPEERDRREQLIRDLNAAYAELRVRRAK